MNGMVLVPTIRIDEQVYERLKAQAEPFVDTPNSVLRRVLGLEPVRGEDSKAEGERAAVSAAASAPRRRAGKPRKAAKGTRRRLPPGAVLPEEEYDLPLLVALAEAGGSAPSREVVAAVGEKLAPHFTDLDREALASGIVRWQSRLQFVRLRLIEEGHMRRDAPRGTWAISDAGTDRLRTEGAA
jgi:hypothetical protein